MFFKVIVFSNYKKAEIFCGLAPVQQAVCIKRFTSYRLQSTQLRFGNQSFRVISLMKLKGSFVARPKHNRDLYYNTWSQCLRADETQILNATLRDSGYQHVYRLELVPVQWTVRYVQCIIRSIKKIFQWTKTILDT